VGQLVNLCKKGLHERTPENMVSNGKGKPLVCSKCRSLARASRGPCSIKGCTQPYTTRGWCQTHYDRWRKHGDPMWTPMSGAEIEEEVAWLIEAGMSTFYVAAALKRTRPTLARMLYKRGRHDLAVRFERVDDAA
jgi:hypothetical protein